MQPSIEALARSAGSHPWRTLLVWLVALIAAVTLSSLFLGDALTTDTDFTNEPEAKRAATLLEEQLQGSEVDTGGPRTNHR